MKRKSIVGFALAAGVLACAIFGGSLLTGAIKKTVDIPKEMTSYRDVVKNVVRWNAEASSALPLADSPV
jgi:hypothetical protein